MSSGLILPDATMIPASGNRSATACAIHPGQPTGHLNVREKEVDGLTIDNTDGFIGIRRLDHVKPRVFQSVNDRQPNKRFILNDKNSVHAVLETMLRRALRPSSC
jgi:hypothetical protein